MANKPTPNRSTKSTSSRAKSTQSRSRSSARRTRRKKNDSSLYMGVTLTAVALILLISIVACSIGGGGGSGKDRDNDNDKDRNESSSIDSSMNESSSTVSGVVSNPNSSSHPSDNSSEHSSTITPPPPVNGSTEATKAYEQYIGIEYAIDMTEYEKYVCPENEDDFVFLVNPANPLSSDYVPENLVWCTNIRKGRPEIWSYIDETANYALEAFLAEAAYYGFDDITVTNAYRSYASQSNLFNGYVEADLKKDYVCDECDKYIDISYYPKKVAVHCNDCSGTLVKSGNGYYCEICMVDVSSDNCYTACADCGAVVRRPTREETEAHVLTYSTRPGTSEHQSGLCCDMHNLSETTSAFDNTPEAIWLAQNAHRFGFILRYPPNTQSVTGIKHESWHFRYVGRTAATEIYEMQEKLGLERMYTLDEYVNNK